MGRLAGQICYMSGPMDRVPDRGIVWREATIPKLFDMNIGVLNPLDKPMFGQVSEDDGFLDERDALFNEVVQTNSMESKKAFSDFMRIKVVRPDLAMVDYAHFLIVYIDIDAHLAGTYRELTTALMQRKPCLVVCKQGITKIPFWWWGEIDPVFYFNDFDELFEYLRYVDNSNEQLKFWRFFDIEKIYGGKIKFTNPD